MPSLGLALSGGSDSMALAQLCRDAGIRVERCLHVDHRLRRESQEEAQKVQRWAGDLLDLPCDISSMPWQPEACPFPASRAQREGRLLRRKALRDWAVSHGLPLVLMAHHADDQAETFFMRVAQQTGLQGLQCIRPLAPLHVPTPLSKDQYTRQQQKQQQQQNQQNQQKQNQQKKHPTQYKNNKLHHRNQNKQQMHAHNKRNPVAAPPPSPPPAHPSLDYPVWLLRPLLEVPKAALRAYCQHRSLPFLPSLENLDPTLNPRQAVRGVLAEHPALGELAARAIRTLGPLNERVDREVVAFLEQSSTLYHSVPGNPIELDLAALLARHHGEHLFRVLEILNHDIGAQAFGVDVAQIARFLAQHRDAFLAHGRLPIRVTLGALVLQSLGAGWVVVQNAQHPNS